MNAIKFVLKTLFIAVVAILSVLVAYSGITSIAIYKLGTISNGVIS